MMALESRVVVDAVARLASERDEARRTAAVLGMRLAEQNAEVDRLRVLLVFHRHDPDRCSMVQDGLQCRLRHEHPGPHRTSGELANVPSITSS